ncbi:LMOD2 protein, partial [Atractosteus spatula]|nr:LMOD2 protein [Atractosteus spatula]
MTAFGYRKELDKYEDIDEDELLASLTSEEIQELERELADIEPDDNVPTGLRQKDQTQKTPTGTFSREALLKYWEKETQKLLESERTVSGQKQQCSTLDSALVRSYCICSILFLPVSHLPQYLHSPTIVGVNTTNNIAITWLRIIKVFKSISNKSVLNYPVIITLLTIRFYDLTIHNTHRYICNIEEAPEKVTDSEEECVTESNSEASEEEPSADEDEEDEDSEQEEENNISENEDEAEETANRTLQKEIGSQKEDKNHDLCNGQSAAAKNCIQTPNEDPNLKVVTNRPCGNPIVIDDALEKISNNDINTNEVNLNNIENISKETLIHFTEALKSNTVVRVFSLANTHADDHVALAIAQMLKENNCITNLNIESNFITGKGILAIMRALQQNTALTELRFHNQRHICGGQVEMEIAKLLKENTTLLKLGYHFELPGPRMSMTSILTRNQDRHRQKRLLEQKQQGMERKEGSDGPSNPRTNALQKGTPSSSPYTSPKSSPWSSPKVARTPPMPQKKVPTRKIAEVIKLHEQSRKKQQLRQQKPKTKKSKKSVKENNILKELKNALKPVSEKTEEASRPSTPQRSLHDDLMAAIRNSNVKQLRRVNMSKKETCTNLSPCITATMLFYLNAACSSSVLHCHNN